MKTQGLSIGSPVAVVTNPTLERRPGNLGSGRMNTTGFIGGGGGGRLCERRYITSAKIEVLLHFTRGKMHKSAISGHVASENHHINWKKCSIIARDSVKPSRWIREAIHIRKEQGKTINRDLGQYALSSIYDPILSDFRRTTGTTSTISMRFK